MQKIRFFREKRRFGEVKGDFSWKKTNYDEYKRNKFITLDLRLMCYFSFIKPHARLMSSFDGGIFHHR